MKRIFGLLLVMAMVLSLSVPAYAAECVSFGIQKTELNF
jgi:flagellin-like protein